MSVQPRDRADTLVRPPLHDLPGCRLTHPGITINANVTDPNGYTFNWDGSVGTVPAGIQGLNCHAEWYPGEFIEGRSYSCERTEKGHWVMQVFTGASGRWEVSDFKLKFIHVVEPGLLVMPFRERVEGEAVFRGGPNGTTTYGCTSTGACNAFLKPERKLNRV